MKTTARKHHYLPQAYLAAFTDTESKDGQFYVLDIHSGKPFRTSPKNVAVERDFNRVDIEGKPLDYLEQKLSVFEGRAVQAIINVNRTKTFPTDEDYHYIINLLCLIAVRNPQIRKSFNRSRELSARIILDILSSDKNAFDYCLKKAQGAGDVPRTEVSFEEVKRFIEDGYHVEFAPDHGIEFQSSDELLPILGRRIWSLLVSESQCPGFICSDHPVTLNWKNHGRGPIGYGLRNTEAFFPLGKRTGFYGVFEEALQTVVNVNPAQVAMMNTRVMQSAERHIFSAMDTFFLWDKGRLIEVDCGCKTREG